MEMSLKTQWKLKPLWNKEIFGKVEREIYQKQLQLQDIQNSILTIDDVRKERIHREDLELLMHREELMWAQKARSNWRVLGDRNANYFSTGVKQRRAKNRILQLKTAIGNVTKNPMEIETTLVYHFKKFYKGPVSGDLDFILEEIAPLPILQLSDQQLTLLNRPITNEEIETTVF